MHKTLTISLCYILVRALITNKEMKQTDCLCHTYCISYNLSLVIHTCVKLSLQQVSLRNCRIYYIILICVSAVVFVSYTSNKPFVGNIFKPFIALLQELLIQYKLLQQP